MSGLPAKEQFYLDSGLRLKVLRRHLGHTPESFAAALGMTKGSSYLPYEKGQRGDRGWTRMVFRIRDLDLPQPVSWNWLFAGEYCRDGERNDNRPVFRHPDNSYRPIPARRRVTDRSGNVVTVDFIGPS